MAKKAQRTKVGGYFATTDSDMISVYTDGVMDETQEKFQSDINSELTKILKFNSVEEDTGSDPSVFPCITLSGTYRINASTRIKLSKYTNYICDTSCSLTVGETTLMFKKGATYRAVKNDTGAATAWSLVEMGSSVEIKDDATGNSIIEVDSATGKIDVTNLHLEINAINGKLATPIYWVEVNDSNSESTE